MDSGNVLDITGMTEKEKGSNGEYYLFSKENYHKSPWYGGFSYVDLLVTGVTEKFIEVTMDGYERAMGSEFGKQVPGIFTDEPNIEVQGRGNIRWTPDLFMEFEKTWNYDLQLQLPCLFEETGDWKKVRHNYYQTLLQMFIDRWAKPWFDYTEQKGLEWTGHYWEHGWPNPNHGGDNMAMYAWHQRPAIDMLFNQFNDESPSAQFGNIRAVKELSSVANQMGCRRTLSETYGGGGWELTFMDMKRLGDWEYVLGVNTMNQHLSHMTIAGARKYDYPPSFSSHSPWWPYYRHLNLYFSRLSLALSRGVQTGDILIIEPTTSAWMYATRENPNPRMKEIGREFQTFVTTLEKAQVEYDLGSENIIKDQGYVQDTRFIVGKKEYSTVVIPPGFENFDVPTFKLLKQYIENGGSVLAFSQPDRIDGAKSDAWLSVFPDAEHWHTLQDLDDGILLKHLISDDFAIAPESDGNLYHHRRVLSDGQLIFLANSSMDVPCTGKVRLQGQDVLHMDLFSGNISDYPESKEGPFIAVDYDLPPAGSLLLFISDREEDAYPDFVPHIPGGSQVVSSDLVIERLEPNVLTIDFCDLTLSGSTYQDLHTYSAADMTYKHHGFQDGDPWNHSVQFRSSTVDRDVFPAGTGFLVTYKFNMEKGTNPAGMKMVIERPENWSVTFNGNTAVQEKGAWWLDREFAVYDISDHVKPGENQITLKTDPMRVHAEIEPVYILGDFGLKPAEKGWSIAPTPPLSIGSWKEQGLPLYGHDVSYRKTFSGSKDRSYFLELGKWKGTAAVVKVNGKEAGIVMAPPYTLDISELVADGDNEVDVVVIGSLKNTLGPHHNNPTPGLVSPWQWRGIEDYPSGADYDLLDYGLLENFKILVAP